MTKTNTVSQNQVDYLLSKSEFRVFHRVFGKQCIVVAQLPNGFTIVGESACVDPENYEDDIGYSLALSNIKKKLWELEGYLLQTTLTQ